MPILVKPLRNAHLVLVQTRFDKGFGGATVGVRGCSRNLTLASETVAKILVGAGDMFSECVPAASFVLRKIAATCGASRTGFGPISRLRWFGRIAAQRQQEKRCQCATQSEGMALHLEK